MPSRETCLDAAIDSGRVEPPPLQQHADDVQPLSSTLDAGPARIRRPIAEVVWVIAVEDAGIGERGAEGSQSAQVLAKRQRIPHLHGVESPVKASCEPLCCHQGQLSRTSACSTDSLPFCGGHLQQNALTVARTHSNNVLHACWFGLSAPLHKGSRLWVVWNKATKIPACAKQDRAKYERCLHCSTAFAERQLYGVAVGVRSTGPAARNRFACCQHRVRASLPQESGS